MSKNLIGLVLIDAPHSALNNDKIDESDPNENFVRIKSFRKGKQVYPYVSGQAWRNWWRVTLGNEFGWVLSPITWSEKSKTAFTAVSPVEYDDDDIFGYMKAPKKGSKKKEEGKEDEKTVTRISPLKCSPLIAVNSQQLTDDWGVMARQNGYPVIYQHQFYSCILKGIFSLDLDAVGVLWSTERTGYKNISKNYISIIEQVGGRQLNESSWILPREVRLRRARQVLEALPVISGGAKLTSHLTDVTPKLLVMTVLDGGNHPFMNLMVERNDRAEFSISALKQVISDYSDRILDHVYIGRREGFMDELEAPLQELASDSSLKIIYGSPNQVVKRLSEKLSEHIGE